MDNNDKYTSWIFPCNPQQYHLHEYFQNYDIVDWKQGNYKINVGDYAYIYCSMPEQKIRYQLQVTAINISYEDTIDDRSYWGINNKPTEKYCRLKLISSANTDSLRLERLLQRGLKNRPQGKQKVDGELLCYIKRSFGNAGLYEPSEIQETETIFEGAKKTITVNKYERNPAARQKCIEANGCKCCICGMDFEETYGELGSGFIHVHHLVPISSIGKTYRIDPINDLAPVCPNCHAMLHRGQNGRELSIEELKAIIANKKK